MSFRVVQKKLAQPVAHAGATAAAVAFSSNTAPTPVPLLQFPAFHPIPFQYDKFLSIKTRSLETYTKHRSDVLQRCAELRSQIQRTQERAKRRSNNTNGGSNAEPNATPATHTEATSSLSYASAPFDAAAASFDPPFLPLTPHQAEELLLLSKKVESLADFQGMILTDELVWRMFHICVQCGAPQQALDNWLHKHILAEKRGPPYPLFIIEDLATLLRTSVLSRIPESGAGLSCGSSILLSDGDRRVATTMDLVGLEDGLAAAQRYLQLRCVHGSDKENSLQAVSNYQAQSTQLYVAHLMNRYVWPVWRSLEAMQLTLETLKDRNDTEVDDVDLSLDAHTVKGTENDGEWGATATATRGERASLEASFWPPNTAEQTLAVRTALMSVTPLYSFHEKAEASTPTPTAQAKAGGQIAEGQSSKPAPQHADAMLALGPPLFQSEIEAVVAVLRALLDVWLVVAQCASEAKDTHLLREVQRTVCVGFLLSPSINSAHIAEGGNQATQACSLNEVAWCQYALSPLTSRTSCCQDAAEALAREIVHNFVGGVLSVVQYGLLCATQEEALWQLHDTSALIAGGASMLHWLRNASKPFDSRYLSRRLQALTVVQHQTTEEAERGLLCNVLPRAIRSSVHMDTGKKASDDAMMVSVRAFLLSQMQRADGKVSTVPTEATLRYADAGIYVGLAMNDLTLLQQAATVASMSEREVAGLRLTADVLQRYRRTVSSAVFNAESEPDHGALVSGPAEPEKSDETWSQIQHLMTWNSTDAGDSNSELDEGDGEMTSTAQLHGGCLQAVLLDTAQRQAACAAAYVQAIRDSKHNTAVDAEENDDGEGREEYTDVESHASSLSSTEEVQLEVAEKAWADLQAKGTRNVVEGLERVAVLLGQKSACLSPSALSSLAVFVRVGIYFEQEGRSSSSSSETPTSLSIFLDTIISRLAADTCTLLQTASVPTAEATPLSVSNGPTAAVVGTWVQWVLITLVARKDWVRVLAMLKALDGDGGKAAGVGSSLSQPSSSLLCATTIDPAVFAAIYAAAQEDGAASVCAHLRPRRESLFF